MSSSTPDERRNGASPRHRRRWILLAVLLLIVAIPVGHALWREHEWRKLHALIDHHRAMGEPVLPEDFNQQNVENPNNPATELIAAAAAVPTSANTSDWRHDPLSFQFPMTPAEVEKLRPILEQGAVALAHAKAAAARTGPAKWPVQFSSPVVLVSLPHLTTQRQLGRLLRAAAADAHRRGDDAEAVERVHEILFQAHAMYRHPTLVAHLVAVGLQALGNAAARDIAPDLQVGSSQAGQHRASPEQVRQLIHDLVDERPIRDGQQLALLSERMSEVDAVESLVNGKIASTGASPSASPGGSSVQAYLISPIFYQDAQLLFDRMTSMLAIARADDWKTCQTQLRVLPDPGTYGNAHILFKIWAASTSQPFTSDFRAMADSRLTAIMLATSWYAGEHKGKLPGKLDELIPQYLKEIPADPFASPGILRYRPDADDPLVYSVGEDGVDNGASTRPSDPTIRRKPNEWDLQDYVVHLKRQPREPEEDVDEQQAEPATEPAATQPETATTGPS